jgi:Ser/Thr protein kinase RdoA (MazF antagonist)
MNAAPEASEALAAVAEGWWPAARVAPLGEGHIHATWLVEAAAGGDRYVLQRLSTAVFGDPASLMEKVARVVTHVQTRAPGRVPVLVPTRRDDWWLAREDGSCWRLWRYVAGARTLQALATPAQAESAGRAFGSFQTWLRDLPGAVADPIEGFMQLDHYLARLDAALAHESTHTASAEVRRLVELTDARRDLAGAFSARDRLVHGDCKVNNLLFDSASDEVVCILDLDTVMRGHWAWDAGDLLRSAAADGDGLSLERFAAVVRGMRETGVIEAPAEAWVLAPRYVTLMLGVRFLTDHLEGDWYFRVQRHGENLERARAQFRLLAEFERHEPALLAAANP